MTPKGNTWHLAENDLKDTSISMQWSPVGSLIKIPQGRLLSPIGIRGLATLCWHIFHRAISKGLSTRLMHNCRRSARFLVNWLCNPAHIRTCTSLETCWVATQSTSCRCPCTTCGSVSSGYPFHLECIAMHMNAIAECLLLM